MENKHNLVETSKGLWDRLYRVFVQEVYLHSTSHVKMYGSYITMLPIVDSDARNRSVEVYINIDKIIEYHREGARVILQDKKDLVNIYQVIETHLREWYTTIMQRTRTGKPPYDDLITLDQYCQSIYQDVINLKDKEPDIYYSFFEKFHHFSFDMFKVGKKKETSVPERESYLEYFRQQYNLSHYHAQ